jgi:hypothetical protein
MIEKNSEEWKIFKRIWDLYKKYHTPEDKSRDGIESHVDALISDLGSMGQEYVGSPNEILVKGLIVALADDFAYRHKIGAFK